MAKNRVLQKKLVFGQFCIFLLNKSKNHIKHKVMGHKIVISCINNIRQKYSVYYEKKLKPKNPLLFAKANEPSFFIHSLISRIIGLFFADFRALRNVYIKTWVTFFFRPDSTVVPPWFTLVYTCLFMVLSRLSKTILTFVYSV